MGLVNPIQAGSRLIHRWSDSAGKSTLINLLGRFIDGSGDITGLDIHCYDYTGIIETAVWYGASKPDWTIP